MNRQHPNRTNTLRPSLKYFTALATAVALTACSGLPQQDPDGSGDDISLAAPDELDQALSDEYGDNDEADEAPNFDDADFEDPELDSGEEPVDDTLADMEEEALPLPEGVERPRRVRLALVWGHMRPGPGNGEVKDWSGTISVENAGLRVVRTVGFEGATDAIVLPRTDFSTVEVQSYTKPHVDGVVLDVVLHPELGSEPGTPPVLHIDNASFTGSVALELGMALGRVIPVDDAGNAIGYHIIPRRPDRPDCRQGFIAGRYIKVRDTDDGRELGRLKGKVLNDEGQVIGKLRGVWGERAINGSQVLFAKIINNEGRFVGTVAGHYRNGHFRARVLSRDRTRIGVTMGHYRTGPAGEGGLFRGRFSELCGELPDEGAPEAHDEDEAGMSDLSDAEGETDPAETTAS
jgi:hypothetical protein